MPHNESNTPKFWRYFSRDEYGNIRLRIGKIVLHAVIALILVVVLVIQFPMGTVGAGERGVLLRFNAVTGKIYDEGLYFRIPFIERIVKVDVKVQKEQTNADAASKDLQTVTSTIALNFHIQPTEVAKLYQEVGIEYKERIISPVIQEAVKASTAKFTAEELVTKREVVREDIKVILREKLGDKGIVIDEFNIVNFDFSKAFNDAIEKKVTAEQDALAAKNKLEQIKFEAQQKIEEAKGKAEAIKIEALALQKNPQVLELRALEKWNGVLPQVTGGAIPFVSVEKLDGTK